MEDDRRELQLLPTPPPQPPPPPSPPHTIGRYSHASDNIQFPIDSTSPSLDLQLSINLRPINPLADHHIPSESFDFRSSKTENEQLEADEVRILTMEKAYAERVKEMTKREMELAESEFSRARHVWERAVEEVEMVEKMKQQAIRRIDSSNCIEITCQACRKTFRR